MVRRRSDERISRSISLLISMLVRYPQVASVKYDPRQQTIRLSLMVSGSFTDAEFEPLRRTLADTLEVYNLLEHRRTAVVQIARQNYGDLTAIEVTREVVTMTPAEIWTVVEFFRERFGERLMAETADSAAEEDMMAQDEMIQEIVADLEGGRMGRDLIAIREEGRVMVFQR